MASAYIIAILSMSNSMDDSGGSIDALMAVLSTTITARSSGHCSPARRMVGAGRASLW